MKKIFSLILSVWIICSVTACSSNENSVSEPVQTATTQTVTETVTEEPTIPPAQIISTDEKSKKVMKRLETLGYSGVVSVVKDGKLYCSYAKGMLEDGTIITTDTPMPVGSVSKQFCACAVMLLQEQGKLNVSDKLEKYFPEYTEGKDITLHNLLSMRSGVPELNFSLALMDKTDEENTKILMEDIFSQSPLFDPDSMYTYTNANYFLLGNIVEKVSGKKYFEFLRESFFEPLGMTHTGSVDELPNNPKWAGGHTYIKIDGQPGLTKGAGDIISNTADMHIWLEALHTGKSVSLESYKTMTTDYSSENPYGYALVLNYPDGGIGHSGLIGSYSAQDYISEELNMMVFMDSNNIRANSHTERFYDLLDGLNGTEE